MRHVSDRGRVCVERKTVRWVSGLAAMALLVACHEPRLEASSAPRAEVPPAAPPVVEEAEAAAAPLPALLEPPTDDPVVWLARHPEVTLVERRELGYSWHLLVIGGPRSFACLTDGRDRTACRDLQGPIERTWFAVAPRPGPAADAVLAVEMSDGRQVSLALRAPELDVTEMAWTPAPDASRPSWYPLEAFVDRAAPTLPAEGWSAMEPLGDRDAGPLSDRRVRTTQGDGLALADVMDDERRTVCVRTDVWRCAPPTYYLDIEAGAEGYQAVHRLEGDPQRVVAQRDEYEFRGFDDDQAGDAIRVLEIYEANGAVLRLLGTIAIGAAHWEGSQSEPSPTRRFLHGYSVTTGCIHIEAPESQLARTRIFRTVGRARRLRLPSAPDMLRLDPRRETPWVDDSLNPLAASGFGPYQIEPMDLAGDWSVTANAIHRRCSQ